MVDIQQYLITIFMAVLPMLDGKNIMFESNYCDCIKNLSIQGLNQVLKVGNCKVLGHPSF